MTFDEYQKRAFATAIYPARASGSLKSFAYVGLKLSGEAGEVSENIGKAIRDDHFGTIPLNASRRMKIVKEAGDVLWYLAALATELGIPMSQLASENLLKLESREERGVLQGSGDDR